VIEFVPDATPQPKFFRNLANGGQLVAILDPPLPHLRAALVGARGFPRRFRRLRDTFDGQTLADACGMLCAGGASTFLSHTWPPSGGQAKPNVSLGCSDLHTGEYGYRWGSPPYGWRFLEFFL
jgi:hypothetical protein